MHTIDQKVGVFFKQGCIHLIKSQRFFHQIIAAFVSIRDIKKKIQTPNLMYNVMISWIFLLLVKAAFIWTKIQGEGGGSNIVK